MRLRGIEDGGTMCGRQAQPATALKCRSRSHPGLTDGAGVAAQPGIDDEAQQTTMAGAHGTARRFQKSRCTRHGDGVGGAARNQAV